jgi:glycine cleavage system aminomethyltransferase T
MDKPAFLGRDALAARASSPPARRLTCLLADAPADVVMGKEPVYDGTGCVGYVTSAAYGYTVGRAIAYAWLPAALATPGRTLSIGYFDRWIEATVSAEPLYDPGMTRLRA